MDTANHMPRRISASASVRMPPHSPGRDTVSFSVDAAGRLFFWSAERVDLGYYDEGVYRFLLFSDESVMRLPIPDTAASSPLLVPFSDGRLLTIDCRGGDSDREHNAIVYAHSGEKLADFHTDDAVQDVQISPGGYIWVSYFDQSETGQSDCFSSGGQRLFSYASFWKGKNLPRMYDCYALNVPNDREAWFYYFRDFPLVCVRDFQLGGKWDASPVRGARSFAVDSRYALFAGMYQKVDEKGDSALHSTAHGDLLLLTLSTGVIEPLQLVYDSQSDRIVPVDYDLKQCVGRGSRLYVSDGSFIHIVDLTQIA